METRRIKEISQLLEELDPSFWGSITLRIQRGEVVNVKKEQSIKIDRDNNNSQIKQHRTKEIERKKKQYSFQSMKILTHQLLWGGLPSQFHWPWPS